MDRQNRLVEISVESKLYLVGLLVLDLSQYICPLLLIEYIVRINEEETPVLLMVTMFPHYPHCVNNALDYGIQPHTNLICHTSLIDFWSIKIHDALVHHPPHESRVFVDTDQHPRSLWYYKSPRVAGDWPETI